MGLTEVLCSANPSLIDRSTLLVNLALCPLVVVGLLVGRRIVAVIPRRLFDTLLLAFTVIAAVRLIAR